MTPIEHEISVVRSHVLMARGRQLSIGCIPTMGALHEGHASLIRAAAKIIGFNIVTIFVNPLQFGPNEDYARYPRTLDADRALCAEAGADMIFCPSVAEMGTAETLTSVDVGRMGDHLCGRSRPGHFRGVTTIVLKLFNIVQPDWAFFGAKDAQQLRIIERMRKDLNLPIGIIEVPTVREADGLAMSSRNRYLSEAERAVAPKIYRALQMIRDRAASGETDAARLESALKASLEAIPGSRVDYASIVDDATLQPLPRLDRPALAAVAVFLGTMRLIDNIMLIPRP